LTSETSTAARIAAVYERATRLYSAAEVETQIQRLAVEISGSLSTRNPLLLCIMNGGLVFTGKLITYLDFPLQLDYLHATRYRNSTRGHELEWSREPVIDIADRDVLILDDILDEGATLLEVRDYVLNKGASSVQIAVLTDKQHDRRLPGIKADYIGLSLEDRYVFGYGLDYQGYLRNAPGIFAIADEDY
jgi:hypoxanthine phosphoribosyltransferase